MREGIQGLARGPGVAGHVRRLTPPAVGVLAFPPSGLAQAVLGTVILWTAGKLIEHREYIRRYGYDMPEITGWEVVRWLGEHPEHRPPSIIVVSAAGPDVLRALDPTIVNAIIFKPFDVVELGAYVSDTVRRQARDRRKGRVVLRAR